MAERVRFENPPVVEVVCGVLFSPITSLRTAHVGLYWNEIRQEFPSVDEAPPLPSVIETFEPIQSVQVQLELVPPLVRTWFHRADRRALIQLQRDRFTYNWKRQSPNDGEYPSYDRVIVDFEHQWKIFCDFVKREQIGEIILRQLELVYVNIIPDASIPVGDPVFVDHAPKRTRSRFLPPPDSFAWQTSYPLHDSARNSAGRLHVRIGSARQADSGDPIRRLDMVARGINEMATTSMRTWFDLAHDWIVHGFVDLTTPNMQAEVWRRQS